MNPVLVSTNIWFAEAPEHIGLLLKEAQNVQFGAGAGLPGQVLASGKAEWLAQLDPSANFPPAQLIADLGLRANRAFPVLVGDQVVAVLEFFSRQIEAPEPNLLTLIGSVCIQIGRVMERKQAERAFQEQFRRLNILNQITAAIAQRQDLTSIFRAVLRFLETYMLLRSCGVFLFDPGEGTLTLTISGDWRGTSAEGEPALSEGLVIPAQQSGLWPATPGIVYCVPNSAEMDAPFLKRCAQQKLYSVLRSGSSLNRPQ